MSHEIIRNARPNPNRPRMAPGFLSTDRTHIPHHLRRHEVEQSRLQVEAIFSPIGKWVELRFAELYSKAGSKRDTEKVISTNFDGPALLALCDFFDGVRKGLSQDMQVGPDTAEDIARLEKDLGR